MSISFDWLRQPGGASLTEFGEVERLFEITLPKDYCDFAAEAAGGIPTNMTDFEFITRSGSVFAGVVGVFLSPRSEESYSIQRTAALLSDWLPKKLVPVIEDPAGSFICLDYTLSDLPCVSFWRHDRKGCDNELSVVAPSFSAFLAMLHDPDPSEDDDS